MEKKKIIIITNYIYPENFKINDIAFDLSANNYDVTVLTGVPNYPSGIFYDGYGFFKNKQLDSKAVLNLQAKHPIFLKLLKNKIGSTCFAPKI